MLRPPHPAVTVRRRLRDQRGLSLVELMIALTISSILIVGVVYVYSQSRATFRLHETVARLQEDGRYVLSVLEPDIRLAGYFGFSNSPGDFRFVADGGETPLAALRQDDDPFPGIAASAHACGANFALDLFMTVQGSNDEYPLECPALGGGAIATADTLTVRRAALEPVDAGTGIQLLVNRLKPTNQMIFHGAAPATVTEGLTEVRDLVVNTYYIAESSEARPGVPALRVKFLTVGAGGEPEFQDEELMPGVEDLQVQFGIDPGADLDGDGVPDDVGGDGLADLVNGRAARYVDPDSADLLSAQVVSVRIWLRLRAEQPEQGFTDDRTYVYGTTDVTPNDNIRRVVVSRTIYLRNARVLEGAGAI